MNLSTHINYKKIIASLLLALLFFIYAEKVFHIHDKLPGNTEQAGISLALNNTGCAICDFTVAKEAELPQPLSVDIPLTFLIKEYTSASVSYHFQPENSTSNRGPPLF